MSTVQATLPFAAIPLVEPPPDYGALKPAFLARTALSHGPIFALNFPNRPIYLVGPEANRLVLQTHREHFSHDLGWTPIVGELFGHGLLTMDGEEHARVRKL